ncbi:glycosyltransferase [Bradyrhizobium sp. CSA112]|uniref:glycosyltransferase family 4 protein n=1 Tax=Bradyrhizobium sp. CSA112 TaxID=2699170 RepID=UPI0023B0513C|nr:glycosyltransferase family 4 protein [Bradyrhizobium sp. CSA112]MDE5452814.1 glycosyltransferase [Bradyrhizobium sp. CSA112]
MSSKHGTVLFLEHEASRTGASIFLLRLLRWLRANSEFGIHILAGSSGEMLSEFQFIGTVDTIEPRPTLPYKVLRRLKMSSWHDKNHLAKLRKGLARGNIRLIYANSIASARMLDFLSFLACPVICHVHELDGAIQGLGLQNIRVLERHKSHYIAVSHAVRQNLTDNYGISARRIQTIHGFIPLSNASVAQDPSPEAIRLELGIPQHAKIVCGCGSIEHRKGIDLFLRVAAEVTEKNGAAGPHFVWIGGKRQNVHEMRKQVSSSGLQNLVHFIGNRPNVAPYFEAADIFLLTSREDPFPLVMLEAALHQLPIICFDHTGGAPEFLQRDTGFIVPKFDIEKMADKVVELLASPELCRRTGTAAKQKVISCHDLSVGGAKIASIIEYMLRARSTDMSESAVRGLSPDHSRAPGV